MNHKQPTSTAVNPVTIIDVLNHHINGGKFEYQSFDFKKAADEYEKTQDWKNIQQSADFFNQKVNLKDKYQIPENIRNKYIVWRVGKLRQIDFNPSGNPYRIKLGAKYAVTFYEYGEDLLKIRLI